MIETLFADVILPLPLHQLFTYRIPRELNEVVMPGQRVMVQFGKQKVLTALIRTLHSNPPKQYEAKYILSLLDQVPIINEKQFEHWEWMAAYYMCGLGEVMNAALPSALKLESETKILLNNQYSLEKEKLNDQEFLIVEALEVNNILTLEDIAAILDQKIVYPIIKSLLEKGIIFLEEEVKKKFKPKIKTFIKLNPQYADEDQLKQIFDKLEKKAAKQLDLLMAYLHLSKYNSNAPTEVSKENLLKFSKATDAALNALFEKNILEKEEREVGRFLNTENLLNELPTLNEYQEQAFNQLTELFNPSPLQREEEKRVILLHGITSSGKTEIYIRLIQEAIEQGKQVLYLLPEIALTTQIITRLKKVFGNKVGVYHSRLNHNERVEVWNAVLNPQLTSEDKKDEGITFKIVLGARSALFLPFNNLGLVIVDEEHENSYKQFDPSPRYNARNAAIYLARIHGAKTLLGSATPSIESFYNAQAGKYGFVQITKRHGNILLPEILVADIKEETKKKRMKSIFTPLLAEAIANALKEGEQIILFQNRRGFVPIIECTTCNWIPRCIQCDVSLTYHKYNNQIKCHYCGYTTKVPIRCGACGNATLILKGLGTEKIVEETEIIFPKAKVLRMDLDTTRSKHAYHQIISDFEDKKIDILVGTQMVSKGLDFDNVSLVGILNADSMLYYPDFRAFEHSFQLMAQVSGRAGRKNKRGKVIIQTSNPYHNVIQYVVNNDYDALYQSEIIQRRNFNYPPFYRLIEFSVKHKDKEVTDMAAQQLAADLKILLGKRIIGPEYPMISRIKNLYIKNIIAKIELNLPHQKIKEEIKNIISQFKLKDEFKSVRIMIDVDPQ